MPTPLQQVHYKAFCEIFVKRKPPKKLIFRLIFPQNALSWHFSQSKFAVNRQKTLPKRQKLTLFASVNFFKKFVLKKRHYAQRRAINQAQQQSYEINLQQYVSLQRRCDCGVILLIATAKMRRVSNCVIRCVLIRAAEKQAIPLCFLH